MDTFIDGFKGRFDIVDLVEELPAHGWPSLAASAKF